MVALHSKIRCNLRASNPGRFHCKIARNQRIKEVSMTNLAYLYQYPTFLLLGCFLNGFQSEEKSHLGENTSGGSNEERGCGWWRTRALSGLDAKGRKEYSKKCETWTNASVLRGCWRTRGLSACLSLPLEREANRKRQEISFRQSWVVRRSAYKLWWPQILSLPFPHQIFATSQTIVAKVWQT